MDTECIHCHKHGSEDMDFIRMNTFLNYSWKTALYCPWDQLTNTFPLWIRMSRLCWDRFCLCVEMISWCSRRIYFLHQKQESMTYILPVPSIVAPQFMVTSRVKPSARKNKVKGVVHFLLNKEGRTNNSKRQFVFRNVMRVSARRVLCFFSFCTLLYTCQRRNVSPIKKTHKLLLQEYEFIWQRHMG